MEFGGQFCGSEELQEEGDSEEKMKWNTADLREDWVKKMRIGKCEELEKREEQEGGAYICLVRHKIWQFFLPRLNAAIL